MLPENVKASLQAQIAHAEHPRELAVDVMYALQALEAAARMLAMSPLELEELATFYTFIFREPVGKYVIHVCDSVICWMDGYESLRDYLCTKLQIDMGETTPDGLFTLLPVCCIGYCDRSPAILINRKVYGPLTPPKLDQIIEELIQKAQ